MRWEPQPDDDEPVDHAFVEQQLGHDFQPMVRESYSEWRITVTAACRGETVTPMRTRMAFDELTRGQFRFLMALTGKAKKAANPTATEWEDEDQ